MKKLQKIAVIAIIPVTIVILLTYMLTTDTTEAKHQFKCNNWSAALRDKWQQNTDKLSNTTLFEHDDAFGWWLMEKNEYEKECGTFIAYVDTSDASHEEKCDRFLEYVYNFTIWIEISRPNQTGYEQDHDILTFRLLKTQFDKECADYVH